MIFTIAYNSNNVSYTSPHAIIQSNDSRTGTIDTNKTSGNQSVQLQGGSDKSLNTQKNELDIEKEEKSDLSKEDE